MNKALSAGLLMLLLLCTSNCAAFANDQEEGGYYYSLTHPDLGQWSEQDSRFHEGEGYYDDVTAPKVLKRQARTSKDAGADRPQVAGDTPGTATEKSTVAGSADAAQALAAPAKSTMTASSTAVVLPSNAVTKAASKSPADSPVLPLEIRAQVHPATLAEVLKEGHFAFHQGAYHAAQEDFTRAGKIDPRSQDAHYWLGMTKLHLNDHDGAHDELQLAFALNPFTPLGQQARAQLVDVAAKLEKEQRPPVDSPKIVAQTVQHMGRQAASLAAQKALDGARAARWAQYSGQLAARGIYAGAGDYSIGRRHRVTLDREVSNLSRIRSNYVLSDGFVRATHARQDSAQRQQSIQEYMNSSLILMGDPIRSGQPHLRALGTSLYVRYYGSDTADSPPSTPPSDPPLLAIPATYRVK